jgi:polyisoprenoid-binding protein YceI
MTAESLNIDNAVSEVAFTVKKLGFLTIKGTLSDFTGEVNFEKDALDEANFNVSVGASTINTGNEKRDEHLKSKDFFHVNDYPEIHFQSTSIKSNAKGYQATGKLSILEHSKEVGIPFSFEQGVFKGEFTIDRSDYKLGGKFPAFVVGKNINISINCKIKN